MKSMAFPMVLVALLAVVPAAFAGDHKQLYRFDGDSAGDWCGRSVSGAGDVNNDGCDDVIVGTHWGGYVKVYSGKSGKVLYTVKGDSSGDFFGREVNDAGDVNKDGYDDFIVGTDTGGYARVFSGKDGTALHTFTGDSSGDNFGYSVSGAGDVNADGYDDLIVGTVWGNYARVYSGKDWKTLYTFRGDSSKDELGRTVSGAGDLNADGYADVIVATYGFYVRAYSGKDGSTLYTFTFPTPRGAIGRVSDAGDVNNDGYDDVIVGWPLVTNNTSNPSVALVYSGKDGSTLYTLKSGSTLDFFGGRVGGAGDVDGDGYDDVIVGAQGSNINGNGSGSAYVFSGKDGSRLYRFDGGASADALGAWVGGAGDVSGDGRDDIIVGAVKADNNGTDSGSAYVFASMGPTGTLTIDDDALATKSTSVTIHLSWVGPSATIMEVRFRNAGGSWGDWSSASAASAWTLPADEGVKTIEGQLRDVGGLTSPILSDSIILDQTPPIGTVTINGGATDTSVPWVRLNLEYTDLQSSVTDVRMRNQGATWSAWEYVESMKSWTIPAVGGLRTVEVQYRDAAGNVSEVASDSIEYLPDVVAPRVTTVRLCDNWLYVCPEEEFRVLVHSIDNAGGSGLDAFRLRVIPGDGWSDWISYAGGPEVTVPRPDHVGPVTVQAVARDLMGNESASHQTSTYLLREHPSWLGAGGKASGGLSSVQDIDAFTLGLVKGDTLTVKPQTKADDKKKVLSLDIDLVSPAGERFLTGGFPADSDKPGIGGWVVPKTSRYLVVLRVARDNSAASGTYKLKVKVKQAKTNRKVKGEFTGSEIPFDAVAGSKFKASLAGEGLELDGISLIGPDGPVAIDLSGKPGKVKIRGVVLTAGTGTYAIRLAGPATVTAKWSVKLPKIKGTVGE